MVACTYNHHLNYVYRIYQIKSSECVCKSKILHRKTATASALFETLTLVIAKIYTRKMGLTMTVIFIVFTAG